MINILHFQKEQHEKSSFPVEAKDHQALKACGEKMKEILNDLDKLERTHPQSPDYSVQLNYLQTMLSLP